MKKFLTILATAILSFLVIVPSARAAGYYFPKGVLMHVINSGVFSTTMGIAYNPNTNTYWSMEGDYTPSRIYEQNPAGAFLVSSTVPLDGRAIVYRPEDGNIYIRSYNGGLYRLTLPFDGTVTQVLSNIFQNIQCGFTFAHGGNVFDVYNGLVKEYDFATGNELRSFTLDTPYPSSNTYPYNCQIASNGTDLYFLSQPDIVYVYDIDGHLKTSVTLNHPTFDTFDAPFSLSYTNERIYVVDISDSKWYGYRIMGFPEIELSPSVGFACTTIEGAGFAPDSKITVMWDGTPVPTVPDDSFTDSYGNFTAIISVLTPNTPGDHVVKATDEVGNSAEAIFTVVDMRGPQGIDGQQGPPGQQGVQGETGSAGQVPLLYVAIIAVPSIVAIVLAVYAIVKKKP